MKNISILLASVLTVVLLSIAVTACKHEPMVSTVTPVIPPKDTVVIPKDTIAQIGWKCSADSVYYAFDVQPILISACSQAGCHSVASAADGYRLTDYANTIKKGVIAGQANSSKVYTEIANGSMPPRSSGITMTQAQKDVVAKWINQGAKNLTCNPNYGLCDTVNVKFATTIQPIVQNQCVGCHGATSPSAGISLTNYTQINASVKTGRFWGSVAQLAGYVKMPTGSKLQTCELNKIDAWIKRGALNN